MISADGKVIGSVTELFITTPGWKVEAIGVELRKDVADRVGASRTMFHRGTIEVDVASIQSVGDAVVLTVDVEQLPRTHAS